MYGVTMELSDEAASDEFLIPIGKAHIERPGEAPLDPFTPEILFVRSQLSWFTSVSPGRAPTRQSCSTVHQQTSASLSMPAAE